MADSTARHVELPRRIRSCAVVGGTHGNELTGLALLKKWRKNPSVLNREGLGTTLLVTGNPTAVSSERHLLACDDQTMRIGTHVVIGFYHWYWCDDQIALIGTHMMIRLDLRRSIYILQCTHFPVSCVTTTKPCALFTMER
jgi:hypothetical protein